MKPCYYCNGRKFQYIRDDDLKISIRCEKCGGEIKTPYLTLDSARGYWNMKMATLEKNNKQEAAG